MAANLDDGLTPLDLSIRRNSNNDSGTTYPPSRNRNWPQSRLFPPAPLPHNMGAPASTSFETYSHSQAPAPAPQADVHHFPRGLQPTPGQFFNPENALNLYPQPMPPPVPPTSNNVWNRNNHNNNQVINLTGNPGIRNINGNNGPPGFHLPWNNPYAQPLFPFQSNAAPTQGNFLPYNFGHGSSPFYEHPHPIYSGGQPGPSFHPPPTHSHSSYNSWAHGQAAYYREETQGDSNGLPRNAPAVISLVSTGSIEIDTDDGDVIFMRYKSSMKVGNDAGSENENDRDRGEGLPVPVPVLTRQVEIRLHGPPSRNIDEHTDDESPPQPPPQVSIPGPSTDLNEQPESQDSGIAGSDAALNRIENVATSTESFSRDVSPQDCGDNSGPLEAPVRDQEPADRVGVIQFGYRENSGKHPPAILEEVKSEKPGGRSEGNKGMTKGGEGATESVTVPPPPPRPRPTQGNKSPVPVQTSSAAAYGVQNQRAVELRENPSSSSSLVCPRNERKKRINWLLFAPDTDKKEIDALTGELEY